MLRLRSARRQTSSESTDERLGAWGVVDDANAYASSSSSSSSSKIGVSCGTDDCLDYSSSYAINAAASVATPPHHRGSPPSSATDHHRTVAPSSSSGQQSRMRWRTNGIDVPPSSRYTYNDGFWGGGWWGDRCNRRGHVSSSSTSMAEGLTIQDLADLRHNHRRLNGAIVHNHSSFLSSSSSSYNRFGGGGGRRCLALVFSYLAFVASACLTLGLAREIDACRRAMYAMGGELIDARGGGGGGGEDDHEHRRRLVVRGAIDPMRAIVGAMYGHPSRSRDLRDDVGRRMNDGAEEEDEAALQSRAEALLYEIKGWETKVDKARDDVSDILLRVRHLRDDEIVPQEARIESLKIRYDEEKRMARENRETFLLTHEAKSREGNLGSGHADLHRMELSKMNSLEDYERYVKDREDVLWKRIDTLVHKIERDSRREAIEWFGPGPHSVFLDLEYPEYAEDIPVERWTRKRGRLRLDMAPLDLMPVAVNLFLQQVHHGLWDGCSFVYNYHHILQAGPHVHDGVHDGGERRPPRMDALMQRFVDAKLDRMPYPEYREGYPHEAYTVGYAGRPGGPSFYINKANNTRIHGPGGQGHHSLHEEADPCFAKVAMDGDDDGTALMEILDRIPSFQSGNRHFVSQPVVIVNARIMTPGEGDRPWQREIERIE